MSELIPFENYEEIVSPSHEVITKIGKIECNWVNTTLMYFEDPYEDHIRYNDGEALHQLNVLPTDWKELELLEFPREYWPNMDKFDVDDKINVKAGDTSYTFRPSNTTLLLFKQPEFDHVEHKPQKNITKGITIVPDLKKALFEGNYPFRWSPFVDRHTRDFFENLGSRE